MNSSNQPTLLSIPLNDFHGQFAVRVHQYLSEFIRSADQKAYFLLASSGVVFGLLFPRQTFNDWQQALKILSMTFDASCVLCSLGTLWPRQRWSRVGLIAWEGILGNSSQGSDVSKYVHAVCSLTNDEPANELLRHCVRMAKVLHHKYDYLYYAILLFFTGIFFAAAFAIWRIAAGQLGPPIHPS
jgi:hypothetical protein